MLAAAAGAAAAQAPISERIDVCTACHGAAGRAVHEQWPSIAGQPVLFIETQLVLIREGLREVPTMSASVKDLSDADITALARHFAAQKPPQPQAAGDAARVKRARLLADKLLCGSCHLEDFRGQQQVPRLAGQHEAYLLMSMKQLRDRPGPGRDTIMAATLRGLGDAELADLAHFFATYKP